MFYSAGNSRIYSFMSWIDRSSYCCRHFATKLMRMNASTMLMASRDADLHRANSARFMTPDVRGHEPGRVCAV